MSKQTGYSLTRKFFDFTLKNNRIVRPVHVAIYCWCIELNNRLEWVDEFQLPTEDGMDHTGILDKHTFINAIKDLSTWGCIRVIQESKNRFTARYISLKNCDFIITKREENSHAINDEYNEENSHANPHAIPHANGGIFHTKSKPCIVIKPNKPNKHIPKPSTSDGIYPECMSIYNAFILSKTGLPAKINSLTGKSMKNIIEYLKKAVKDKENISREVPGSLRLIFEHYDLWEPFHKNQLNLNQIESNLINIINSIKNGKSTSNKQSRSKYASQ